MHDIVLDSCTVAVILKNSTFLILNSEQHRPFNSAVTISSWKIQEKPLKNLNIYFILVCEHWEEGNSCFIEQAGWIGNSPKCFLLVYSFPHRRSEHFTRLNTTAASQTSLPTQGPKGSKGFSGYHGISTSAANEHKIANASSLPSSNKHLSALTREFKTVLLFQLFWITIFWTRSSALRPSWLAPRTRQWRATILRLAVMVKVWQSTVLRWCSRRTLSPPMVSSTLSIECSCQTQVGLTNFPIIKAYLFYYINIYSILVGVRC